MYENNYHDGVQTFPSPSKLTQTLLLTPNSGTRVEVCSCRRRPGDESYSGEYITTYTSSPAKLERCMLKIGRGSVCVPTTVAGDKGNLGLTSLYNEEARESRAQSRRFVSNLDLDELFRSSCFLVH
ncbi:hypothetical protein ANTQUA_LOCUS9894 [Anthophora quadrimaculata]